MSTDRDRRVCFGEAEDYRRIQLACCICFGPVLRALDAHDNFTQAFFHSLAADLYGVARVKRLVMSPPLPQAVRAMVELRRAYRQLVNPILVQSLIDVEEIHALLMPDFHQTEGAAQLVNQIHVKQRSRYEIANAPSSGCVANTWAYDCLGRHADVFHSFPPVQGPEPDGTFMDFAGVTTSWHSLCVQEGTLRLSGVAPSRYFQCTGHRDGTWLRQWPILDEEYFEWSAILEAAVGAVRHGRGLRFAEIGAGGFGIWAFRAAVAWHRLGGVGDCRLLLVEPEALDHQRLAAHMAANLPEGRCEVSIVEAYVGSENGPSLVEVLSGSFGGPEPWDIVDIDAQGSELNMLRADHHKLVDHARMLHISTHGQDIHLEILRLLRDDGWNVTVEFTPLKRANIGDYGPFVTVDGHLTALPPLGRW